MKSLFFWQIFQLRISSRFARELVFNWSGWISSQHDSPERGKLSLRMLNDYECCQLWFREVFFAGAWEIECSNLSEEVVVGNGHIVVARVFFHGIFRLEFLETFG